MEPTENLNSGSTNDEKDSKNSPLKEKVSHIFKKTKKTHIKIHFLSGSIHLYCRKNRRIRHFRCSLPGKMRGNRRNRGYKEGFPR